MPRINCDWSTGVVWVGIALVPLVALCGRRLLDRGPTIERAAVVSLMVHFAEAVLLGCGLIVAFRFTKAYPIVRIPFPKVISLLAVRITGALATLTVLNLALGGLGLPFAVAQSRKVATHWLYSRCRNPMGFYGLLCAIAGAVWLQSLHAVLVDNPVPRASLDSFRALLRRTRTGNTVRRVLLAVQSSNPILRILSR